MKKIIFILSILSLTLPLFSQTRITYNGSGNYTLRERTDLRQYNNGKYVGLVTREVTSYITPVSFDNGYLYEGSFFLNQDLMHKAQTVGFGIRDSIPSTFRINNDGNLTMLEDHGYPSFRSFPSFPNKPIKLGDSWQGKAERAVDPLNKGIVTKMPIYVQYKYIGDEVFHDEPVFLLSAQWATRYGNGAQTSYIDWGGDKSLEKAIGSHKATIYVSKITGNSLVVRDTVDETFYYTDGNVIQFKGTIALFTEYPPATDRGKLIPALKRLCELSDSEAEDLKNIPDTNSLIAMLNSPEIMTPENNSPAQEYIIENAETTGASEQLTNQQVSQLASQQVTDVLPSTAGSIAENKKDAAPEWEPVDIELKREELTQKVIAFAENNKKEADNKNKIAVDTTPAGIRLSIQDLQFKANSSELLPGESSRLDQIAELLKTVPEAQLLVEGHTASTGNPKGEKELSIERAQSIAMELTKRGVSAGRFICKGFGGSKPIADNSTPQGKARNRRVEITILD